MNEKFLQHLLTKNVLRFGEFKLKSGRASPYFFNAGNLSDGESLALIGEAYADLIVENDLEFDAILGPAYKGIPLAAATVQTLQTKYGRNARMFYDRKEAKDYGDARERHFVGNMMHGDKVLLVDDVITTGYTKFQMLDKLQTLNMELRVTSMVILFDREETDENGQSATEELLRRGVRTYSVLNVQEVFEYLLEKPIDGKVYVKDEDYKKFKEYQKQFGVKK